MDRLEILCLIMKRLLINFNPFLSSQVSLISTTRLKDQIIITKAKFSHFRVPIRKVKPVNQILKIKSIWYANLKLLMKMGPGKLNKGWKHPVNSEFHLFMESSPILNTRLIDKCTILWKKWTVDLIYWCLSLDQWWT